MSFSDGMINWGKGFVDFGVELADLAYDTVRAPFADDRSAAFKSLLEDNLISGVLATAIGPEGPIGAGIAVLPEFVRKPVRTFNDEVLGPLDVWQDKYLERPAAATALVYNLAGGLPKTVSNPLGLVRGLADTNTWTTAWRIADEGLPLADLELSDIPADQQELFKQELSWGRAAKFALLGTDVLNPQAAVEASQTWYFNLVSGALDFGETLFLDPLLLAGKPFQLARSGKLVVTGGKAGERGVDIARSLQRRKRVDLSPRYSIVPQRGTNLPVTFKLDPVQMKNFTIDRADQVTKSNNWNKINQLLYSGEKFNDANLSDEIINSRLRDVDDSLQLNTLEYEDLINKRAGLLRSEIGADRIDEQTALGLARATNPQMRTNHYKYMMGDSSAGVEAARAATEFMDATKGSQAFADKLDELKSVTEQLADYKGQFEDLKRFDKLETLPVTTGRLAANLDAVVKRKNALVGEIYSDFPAANDWDFGFILDLKTRYQNAVPIDFSAQNAAAVYGNDVATFFADNAIENADLVSAGIDRWLIDSVEGLDELRGVKDLPDNLGDYIRETATLDRAIYAPLRIRSDNALSGVGAKVYETAAKGVKGRRIVQKFSEKTTQRYFIADDMIQANNQFERVIRDFQRIEGPKGKLLSDQEADQLLARWDRLGGVEAANDRLEMFRDVIDEFNKKFAQRAVDENIIDELDLELFASQLGVRYDAANQMLKRARPSGKFGANYERSRVDVTDGDGYTTIDAPLSPNQMASSLLMPRYDLLEEAFDYISRGGKLGAIRRSEFGEDLRSFKKGVISGSDLLMKAWRPAVLLRPAWPLRVVGDESLRVMSVVGAIPQLRSMLSGIGDFRLELMRRRGIDVEDAVIKKMKDAVEGPADLPAEEIFFRYERQFGQDAATDLYLSEINSQWSSFKKTKGLAAKSALGFAVLGPGGAIGSAVTGYASMSRNARKLAQRQIGETYGASLRRKADEMVEAAAKAKTPEQAEELRNAANLLLTRDRKLKDYTDKYLEGTPEANALEVADAAGLRLKQAGRSPFLLNGMIVRNGVGEDQIASDFLRKRVSADRTAQALLRGASERAQQTLEPEFFDYITLSSDNVERFTRSWDRVVNRQWRPTGEDFSYERKYLEQVWAETNSVSEYKENLIQYLNTPDGKKVLQNARISSKSEDSVRSFVDAVYATTNQMLPAFDSYEIGARRITDFDQLRNRLRSGEEISWNEVSEIRKAMPPERVKELDSVMNMNTTIGNVQGVTPKAVSFSRSSFGEKIRNAFTILSALPTDHLARLPFFRASYESEMARRLSAYIDADTGEYIFDKANMQKVIDRVEKSAREKAIKDVRYLLYDLTESTRAEEALSNLVPFLGAWQEVFTRWGHITKENPAFVARVLDNFNEIPSVEDDDGNRYMLLRVPESLKNIPGGVGPFLGPFAGEQIRLSKDAMSMMSSGGPGFGPIATIPLAELAIQEPSLREALDYFWPYGLAQGEGFVERTLNQLAPAWTRRSFAAVAGSDEMDRMTLSVARDRIVTLRQTPANNPDYENLYAEYMATAEGRLELQRDIKQSSQALMFARSFASMVMPTTLSMQSPYQYYIDKLRRYQEENSETAVDRFLEEEGNEFFGIVQRTTDNKNGVMPVIESWENFKKFQPLVEAHPDVGGLITADVGSDTVKKFNEAVYRRQQTEPIAPGSDVKQRERVALEDFITGPDIQEGWEAYRAMIDIRDDELRARGEQGMSTSLQAKSNADVKLFYSVSMKKLEKNHPAWWEAFNVRDSLAVKRTFDGLRAVVANETLMLRSDIQVLSSYLEDRQIVENELRARKIAGGSGNLNAQSNADVNLYWEAIRLKYSDIQEFKDVFNRYLNQDEVQENTWS